jgi:hypothetical protein
MRGSDLMGEKETPKGSFKTNGGKLFVACWECTKGINGQASCSCGMKAKNIMTGCFKGNLLDKFLPDPKEGDKGVK